MWSLWARMKGRLHDARWLQRFALLMSPMGFVAVTAGWITTEVGRQPWTVYGILRTNDLVTPMPGLVFPFVLFAAVYVGLAIACTAVLLWQIRQTIEVRS